jgi:hypothetical protein
MNSFFIEIYLISRLIVVLHDIALTHTDLKVMKNV